MSALIGMRLAGYLKAQYAVAPALAGLAVLAVLYGGGVARAEEAYGVSALVLFPVLAWQAKILLDAEPDVQRRLARVAIGSAGREIGAGLVAAALAALPTVLAALVLPWVFGGVRAGRGGVPLGEALGIGVWAHALAAAAALALGAWASRPIAGTAGRAVSVLAGGAVLAVVLGLTASPVPWLAPPLMAVARFGASTPSLPAALTITGWAVAWAGTVLGGYWWLRRRRP
jgi:hypothetical protein